MQQKKAAISPQQCSSPAANLRTVMNP